MFSSSFSARPLRRALLAAAVAAAACAFAALTAQTAAAATPRCTVSKLLGELRNPSAGAGQRFVTLILTNTTRSTCSLHGYPGMQLLGARNKDLPTKVVRVRASVGTVVLAPGESAKTTLRWGAIAGSGEPQNGRCEPTPARVEVTPPNASEFLVIPWRLGPVCEHGEIMVRPMVRA